MSKTYRYDMDKNGWDIYDQVTGFYEFVSRAEAEYINTPLITEWRLKYEKEFPPERDFELEEIENYMFLKRFVGLLKLGK